MASEARRGCGYRKIGGLYLVGEGPGVICDRLPFPLDVCPCCGHGIKQTRGWTWVDVQTLTGGAHSCCSDWFTCPFCAATIERAGLLWIGEKFYPTPLAFQLESDELGVSRRITALPRGFKLGESWVLLAHPKACLDMAKGSEFKPGIFRVWKPSRVEKILPDTAIGSDEAAQLVEKGITPVFLPANDPDHRGTVYDDEKEAVAE